MDHVQTVTMIETTSQDKTEVFYNKFSGVKNRQINKDSNNNETKEKYDPLLEELKETSFLGLMTFKADIKWQNTISISLLHLTAAICVFFYVPHIFTLTTVWGKFLILL